MNVAEAGALVATAGAGLGGWARKKLATGSLEEVLLEPVGVLGTGSGSVYVSGPPRGLLPTMTWLKVVRMYTSLPAWGSDLAQ